MPSSDKQLPFLFIISPGRSGSSFLRKNLCENLNINIPSETHQLIPNLYNSYRFYQYLPWPLFVNSFIKQCNVSLKKSTWNLTLDKNDRYRLINTKDKRFEAAIHYLYQKYNYNTLSNKGTVFGEKSPILYKHSTCIKNAFSSTIKIIIIRDPISVINSLKYYQLQPSIDHSITRWNTFINHTLNYNYGDDCLLIDFNKLIHQPNLIINQLHKSYNIEKRQPDLAFNFGDTQLKHMSNTYGTNKNPLKSFLSLREIDHINKHTKHCQEAIKSQLDGYSNYTCL